MLLRRILLHHGVVERFLSVVAVDTGKVNLLRVVEHIGHAMLQTNVRAVRHTWVDSLQLVVSYGNLFNWLTGCLDNADVPLFVHHLYLALKTVVEFDSLAPFNTRMDRWEASRDARCRRGCIPVIEVSVALYRSNRICRCSMSSWVGSISVTQSHRLVNYIRVLLQLTLLE